MEQYNNQLIESIASVASELFRFERVFAKAVSKLDFDEKNKYLSQYTWFSKKVDKALSIADLRLVNIEGQLYDPGMAVTPLNIDDFCLTDVLIVAQMIEPIIMKENAVYRIGTVVLGRIEK